MKKKDLSNKSFTTAILIVMMILGFQTSLEAQNYLGLGWHLGMPVRFDNCCTPFFQANPIPVSGFSITYKKELVNKQKNRWYYEIGLTSTGLGYNAVDHENDTTHIVPWGILKVSHYGFPSLLFGVGRNIPLKNKHEFLLGLEGSFRMYNTMGGIYSSKFTLYDASIDATFPVFLRANLGYLIRLKVLKQIPSHLLFYTKISAQNIAKGPQYIEDPVTGESKSDGKYSLNNSEVGVKFYLNLGKQYYNLMDSPPRERKPSAKRTGRANVKISVEQQIYSPRPTQYYMPHVDSFSLRGMKVFPTTQIGIKAEFVHFRNPNWSTVVAIGTGRITESRRFAATAAFSPDDMEIEPVSVGSAMGRYLIQNLGLSYKQGLGKGKLQHTLTACAIEPIEHGIEFSQSVAGHLQNPILEGEFLEKYSHDKFLFGIEYNPEFLFHTNKRVFFGLGMVLNYSWGVIAQGRATVNSGDTTYYGGMLQRMSKIGFTARMGFQDKESAKGL